MPDTAIHDISCEEAKAFICDCPWGFAQITEAGIFDWCNKAYAEQILNAPVELVIGTHYQHWTHPDDLGVDTDLAKKVSNGLIPGYTLSKRYIQRGSTPQVPRELWGLLSVTGRYSETGKFVGYRVMFRPYSNVQTKKLNWEKTGKWVIDNWRTLLTIVTISITLIWGGSEKLSTILNEIKETKFSVESELSDLSSGP